MQLHTDTIHGRTLAYVSAGEGPVLLLIHGIGATHDHWRHLIAPLSRRHTVIAPDLPGHGASGPTTGDYSVGGLAAGLRDLLFLLGHERATLVGHSLGGGVAMQFAYLFPEVTERLALISSGGLGPEVSPLLRAAALPGAGPFIAATAPLASRLGATRTAARLPIEPAAIVSGYAELADPTHRAAFLATLRSVIALGGQSVSALDRIYLAQAVPVLIAWGERDRLVPVAHAHEAHHGIPGSRLELFPGVGHLPQLQAPEALLAVLERFLSETEPAQFDPEDWRRRFRAGAAG
jgi:pimeloyl-ACP methyl ester carboxylesterase